jgi:aspartate racemase
MTTNRTIGLLGGMSWESTETYYRLLNEGIKSELGGLHSAKVLLHSFDFAEIEAMQMTGDWSKSGEVMANAAKGLEQAGAEVTLICTNTMHKLADQVTSATNIPLLHIADATAEAIKAKGFKKVALLGSRFTMEQDFYKGRLQNKHGIDVIAPEGAAADTIHNVIYDELCLGKITAESRDAYVQIIEDLNTKGAEAVILGCTEIGLLVDEGDTKVPLLDTTKIHAEAAVKFAIG